MTTPLARLRGNRRTGRRLAPLLTLLAAAPLGAPEPGGASQTGPAAARGAEVERQDRDRDARVRWDARAAEHLLNRAGFGAGPEELRRAVRRGHEATVAELLDGRGSSPSFFVDPPYRPSRAEKKDFTKEERRDLRASIRRADRQLLDRFSDWWITEMVQGPDPLRERMTLFWHGHFTSSYRDVLAGQALIDQNELFREHALGNFEQLLRAVLRDPAMLLYLDNDQNTRKRPNENLARELLELFTLGEGHYDERDVKEAARALTGWDVQSPSGAEDTEFTTVFREGRHDGGKKRVLGARGRLGLDELVDAVLAREDCARWVAGRLLLHFEGRDPAPERLERYATLLRREGYELRPLLRALFLDPEFYSDEVVGQRIAGPVEYLVGAVRRLELEPPARLVWIAAGQLGQRLFEPPSVRGWEGGRAWISTSTFLQRGNVAGLLLGVISLDQVLAPEPGLAAAGEGMSDEPPAAMAGAMGGAMNGSGSGSMDAEGMDDSFEMNLEVQGRELSGMRRALDRRSWWPRIHLAERCRLANARYDRQMVELFCDDLLAVASTGPSRAALARFLEGERARLGLVDGELLEAGPEAEHVLRRLAHLVLSLPEAQLN